MTHLTAGGAGSLYTAPAHLGSRARAHRHTQRSRLGSQALSNTRTPQSATPSTQPHPASNTHTTTEAAGPAHDAHASSGNRAPQERTRSGPPLVEEGSPPRCQPTAGAPRTGRMFCQCEARSATTRTAWRSSGVPSNEVSQQEQRKRYQKRGGERGRARHPRRARAWAVHGMWTRRKQSGPGGKRRASFARAAPERGEGGRGGAPAARA
mmetsp:Transcript_44876/g.124461  ORF Transcript_44876/g.124461 Transcript_44876/m.124461 type:complete len:209 (+) Transcript_44876:59-685(+)